MGSSNPIDSGLVHFLAAASVVVSGLFFWSSLVLSHAFEPVTESKEQVIHIRRERRAGTARATRRFWETMNSVLISWSW